MCTEMLFGEGWWLPNMGRSVSGSLLGVGGVPRVVVSRRGFVKGLGRSSNMPSFMLTMVKG